MTKEEMINAIRVEMSSKSHIRSDYYMYQETLIGDVLKYIDTNLKLIHNLQTKIYTFIAKFNFNLLLKLKYDAIF